MAVAGILISWEYETVETRDLLSERELNSRGENGWELGGLAFNPGRIYGGSLLTSPELLGGKYIYTFKRRFPREVT